MIPDITWRHVVVLLILVLGVIVLALVLFAPAEWWMELVK